jgi:hypothetical protein
MCCGAYPTVSFARRAVNDPEAPAAFAAAEVRRPLRKYSTNDLLISAADRRARERSYQNAIQLRLPNSAVKARRGRSHAPDRNFGTSAEFSK